MKIEKIQTDKLIPYARNSRTHGESQVAQIAGSIREFGFTNPVLIDNENGIIAGHGRVMAAQKLGLKEVPCIRLSHLTDTQRKAYVIADNKLALNGGWDEEMLALELSELRELDFDLGLLGFDADDIEQKLNPDEPETELSSEYTHKIDAPIYEPKGEKPSLAELIDSTNEKNFLQKIESSKLHNETKEFLKKAASRHLVFDYGKIAEFYCHADNETQLLMEDLALVIIDYKKAMQLGYVKLKEDLLSALESQQQIHTDNDSNE